MIITRVIPCLLKKGLSLVKTVQYHDFTYIGDPINTIQIYNNLMVDELVFLDIEATIAGQKPDFKLIKDLASECFMPLAYGGGIKSLTDMKKIFKLGVEKIVICSYAVENPDFIMKAARLFGSQSVVVSIDVRKNLWGKYEIFTASGTLPAKIDPGAFAELMKKRGAGEILLNSIDKDGTFEGYDTNLIRKVAKNLSIPVIACGGAGRLQDLKKAVKAGASAVAAGSLFVYQRPDRESVLINYPSQEELRKTLGE